MRLERWYWLYVFCAVSLLIHGALAYGSRNLGEQNVGSNTGGIEVTMVPSVEPAPEAKPDPEPEPIPLKKLELKPAPIPKSVAKVEPKPQTKRVRVMKPFVASMVPIVSTFKPIPKPISRKAVSKAVINHDATPQPAVNPANLENKATLPEEMQRESPQNVPQLPQRATALTRLRLNHEALSINSGGGSETSNSHDKNRNEIASPATAKEGVVYNGGGKGGERLPAIAPRARGGGNSILSVSGEENPLGDIVPDEKPGAGSGKSGGRGRGSGGGMGGSKGKAIGIIDSGNSGISSLRKKPGIGIGESVANSEGSGSQPPRGRRNSGDEQPGTGGSGQGYGTGKEVQIGDGYEDLPQAAKPRGIPFGDFAGLLIDPVPSGDGKGRGGIGRGAVFDPKASGRGEGEIHVIYCLDISGSMRDGDKIGKAQDAIKRALTELRTTDSFNIVLFKIHAIAFATDMQRVSTESVSKANAFINNINIGDGTNLSEAMDLAFSFNGVSHIYLMSDGEPNKGIEDFGDLRRFIREKNKNHVRIITLALGLGEDFPGKRLLEEIAKDNNGSFDYKNLATPKPESKQ